MVRLKASAPLRSQAAALLLACAMGSGCNAKRLELFAMRDPVSSRGGSASEPEPESGVLDDDGAMVDDDPGPIPGDDDAPGPAIGGPEPSPVAPNPEPAGPREPTVPPSPTLEPGPALRDAGPNAPAPLEPSADPAPSVDASLPLVDAGRPETILIDDFEDGNVHSMTVGGWWYVTADTTPGTPTLETVAATERPGAYVLHIAGVNYTDWGVIIGLDLRGTLGVFDATPTNAVRFWARGSTDRTFILRLLEQDGGSYTTEVSLTTEWTEFTVPFSAFMAAADAEALDVTSFAHLHFYFGIEPFDVWLDDVAFVSL